MRSSPALLNLDWRRIWEYLQVKQPSLQVAEKQNQSDMASLQHMPKKVQILFLQDVTNKNLSTQRKSLRAVPAGRFGDPEQDIGRVCVHLGSPDFKYMSGETITLEGGLGQRP